MYHDGPMHNETPRFLRIRQILGDPRAEPPVPPMIPVSRSAWWAGIASGRFPAGIKLGARLTVWRAEDIHALIRDAK